jgi:hypothetical protein
MKQVSAAQIALMKQQHSMALRLLVLNKLMHMVDLRSLLELRCTAVANHLPVATALWERCTAVVQPSQTAPRRLVHQETPL